MNRPERSLAHCHADCAWRRHGEPVPLTYDEAARAATVGIEWYPLCVMHVAC